jgi:hypothetical protein
VNVPSNVRRADVRVDLNGRDVTDAFHPGQVAGSLVGLVQGLSLGRNTLSVISAGRGRAGAPTARLALVNHPSTGPIFSGPHQTPWICETQTFTLRVTGGTLGLPLDADCSIATRVDYVYRSTAGTFQALPNPNVHPADLAQTTTNQGRTVPYVVRVETGTINRAIYQTAILHDPATEPAPNPWTRPAGWNGRLIYTFGGGCSPGYHQGTFTSRLPQPDGVGVQMVQQVDVLNDAWLSKGYGAATSSLHINRNNCNDVLQAETMMMVKERFVERYGVPRYTIGSGSSGGSMQQHLIAHNYPGLLDGIQPSSSFPDSLTFFTPISDCQLLDRAFSTSSLAWTFEQKTAVAGWSTWDFCKAGPDKASTTSDWTFLLRAGAIDRPRYTGCSYVIPLGLIYEPVANPGGARCTWQDNLVNVFGRDRHNGFAPRPLDNVGVQYGLAAFNAGRISAEQFLDVNARVGGYDIDGNIVPTRMVAHRNALRIAYRTGRVNSGGGGLPSVPIIDFRTYTDRIIDPHDAVRSRIMRARLIAANGHADNQVIWVNYRDAAAEALRLMDQWLENIATDPSEASVADKVVRNKPAGLVDACYTVTGQKITDPAVCGQLYPLHANPRIAAGEPLANDRLKCKLKPVDARDYTQPLTADQLQLLKAVFPKGVCDYRRRGVEQQLLRATWLSYPLNGDDDDDDEDN